MRFTVDQTQKANAHLHRLVEQRTLESTEHQNTAARLQRDLNVNKDTHIMEVHRLRSAMESDAKAANTEISATRTELQGIISGLQKQLDDAACAADEAKARHSMVLNDLTESQKHALQRASHEQEKMLEEHSRLHEQHLEQEKSQHQYKFQNAIEDKQRSDSFLSGKLDIAYSKNSHLEEKVVHLEEKLEIAKSAAQAAVQAVQATRSTTTAPSEEVGRTRISKVPEKVSPQALRESILVLQEQLQARESSIEELESQLAKVNTHVPAKLKDTEVEISWLRELLSVRVDDLQEIIDTLSRQTYNRETIRDAVIRLKTNLQMEKQEREHITSGGQALPSVSNITNFTASPRALPMAAATAWTNWRKNRDAGHRSFNILGNNTLKETPSKPSSSPHSVLSGLMTPPSTDLKASPYRDALDVRPRSPAKQTLQRAFTPPQGASYTKTSHEEPSTPPLLRKGSYDLDAAEAAVFGREQAVDQLEQDYDKGDYEVAAHDEPFGPRIGTLAS